MVVVCDELRAGTRAAPWSLLDDMVAFGGCLYIPPSLPLLMEVVSAVHAHGHKGVQRTLHCLRCDFHFPDMCRVL